MSKLIRIGFDFDGVIAYNPFRIVRAPVSYIKRNVIGKKKLSFYYPKSPIQKYIWTMLHNSSVIPAKGIGLFKDLVEKKHIEAHLITGRYSFLDNHLETWLAKYGLKSYFKTINLNKKDEQPHQFKHRMIRHYNLDYFIEDNLDIVEYLSSQFNSAATGHKSKDRTKIYWIYNILDMNHPHALKHPYLGKVLEEIVEKNF